MQREQWTDSAVLAEIGRRLRRERLNRNVTRAELAERSGVSTSTIQHVESGTNFSMETLIRLLRALGLLDRVDALLPEPGLSPIELAKLRGKERQRASGRHRRSNSGHTWQW
jgi:putative transcriptional regulator